MTSTCHTHGRVESNEPHQPARWFRYTDASSLGIEIAVAISVSAFAGRYVEEHWTHWSPWTTLIAIAIGIAAAGRAVVRTARNYKRQLAAETAEAQPPTEPAP